MNGRVKYRWNVTLQRDDGEIVEREVRAYWDPEKEGTSEAVGVTAKAEAWTASGRKHEFAPIAVAKVA